jgi:hypothetical protein
MSLAGSLEHVRAVDLVQFIYIGKRTGTLRINAPSHEARIGFHQGHLINARLTGAPRLGELLVLAGLVSPVAIAEALQSQASQQPHRPLGQLLIAEGVVTEADIRQLLAEHFSRVVQEVVGWTVGEFEFVLDELWPFEDLDDAATAAKIQFDTQAILLEALSQLEQPASPEGEGAGEDDLGGQFADGGTVADGRRPGQTVSEVPALVGPAPAGFPRIQLVSRDPGLGEKLGTLLRSERARVTTVPARDAGFSLPGEPPPIVVLDLRGVPLAADSVRNLRRTRSRASVVAYCSPQTDQAPVYDAGAAAVVHGDEQALASCVHSVSRSRVEQSSETLIRDGLREGFARLRRIVGDVRSGLLGTTVSLKMLNVLAESIERAILFIIEDQMLVPFGSFGLASSGKQLAAMSGQLQMSLREPSVFSECAESDRARFARYEDATLPPAFRSVVLPPSSGVFAVLPVSGSQQVIAMIYADNGSKDTTLADVPLLDLAMSQLGLALENEFLRHAREAQRRAAGPPLPPPPTR